MLAVAKSRVVFGEKPRLKLRLLPLRKHNNMKHYEINL